MYYTLTESSSYGRNLMSQTKEREGSNLVLDYISEILACLPNLLYILDKNCIFIGANRNFLELIGLKNPEDLVGKTYKEITQLLPWSEERIQQFKHEDINSLVSGEVVEQKEESPVIDSRNNQILYFQSTRIPLINEDKKVEGLMVILTDVTERKKMEEQLSKVKEQLQKNNAEVKIAEKKPLPFTHSKIPKILMVEDNTIAQKAAQALLMQLDCQVDIAESGDKAIELFKPGKYDLVFMDIGLEGTSGYVVSKQMRKKEEGSGFRVPIIALTGFEAEVVKYDCVDYFMEGALTKPLTSEQAKQIIQHYIYDIDIPVRGLRSTKEAGH
ncbi:response regulator [Legionella jordanis]|nr:response regulator [Legionella jordanis]RMX18663.1 response regulator [Legionella jordanis]